MPSKKPALAKRSLSTFKAAHDPRVIIPAKLKKALEAMAKEGPEIYSYETADKEGAPTMQDRSGLSAAQIAQHRKQFAAHLVKVDAKGGRGKFVWFGTAKMATKARGGAVNPADFE